MIMRLSRLPSFHYGNSTALSRIEIEWNWVVYATAQIEIVCATAERGVYAQLLSMDAVRRYKRNESTRESI